ncbi:hypothetical protein HDV57DRAFT_471802 [Trichoderma longibrachiatum]|uniref:Uncharacterized protein n=1 Tax=Trichoderma longibrachiatum ATCC 18648 TaxID=983965 RepID=A0A2T4C5Z8_TRILO|nr:hypothetical protein M440DRAFT_308793 [Trichoderma longibrachiatum ATCC 18648]
MNEEETTNQDRHGHGMKDRTCRIESPALGAIFRETRSSERVVFAFAWSWASMGRAPPSIVPMRICCSLLSSSCSHTLLMCQRPASYPLGCRPISLPAHSAAASLGLERHSGGDLSTLVPPKIQRQGLFGPGEEKRTVSVMMRERERERESGKD